MAGELELREELVAVGAGRLDLHLLLAALLQVEPGVARARSGARGPPGAGAFGLLQWGIDSLEAGDQHHLAATGAGAVSCVVNSVMVLAAVQQALAAENGEMKRTGAQWEPCSGGGLFLNSMAITL